MKTTGFINKFIIWTLLLSTFSIGAKSNCLPEVSATFNASSLSVTASSTKDLSNVVLKFCDESTQKFDDLSGKTKSFQGTGDNANKEIIGIWIKSGCNSSGDGPGYGEFVANVSWNGSCFANLTEPVRPVLECVDHNANGTFTAHFG
ncbi:MAG: hypothetical protein RLO81_03355, partial [Fulvivirga sp.]|uniref:hypothetical protein n=1 Tax=Fulvivirga sp. TaxID=1931237 RepID=UPI0032F0928F